MKTHITLATYRKEAREALQGKWGYAAVTTLLWFTLSVVLSAMDSVIPLVSIIVGSILTYGYVHYTYSIAIHEKAETEELFAGFTNRFGTIVFSSLIAIIKTLLWSLLLIVPGIIAGISYSQALFIIKNDPHIDAYQSIEKSKKMMQGHKWNYFLLMFSFLPWIVLSLFTFGIGLLFLLPYIYVTMARFYIHLKNHTETADVL